MSIIFISLFISIFIHFHWLFGVFLLSSRKMCFSDPFFVFFIFSFCFSLLFLIFVNSRRWKKWKRGKTNSKLKIFREICGIYEEISPFFIFVFWKWLTICVLFWQFTKTQFFVFSFFFDRIKKNVRQTITEQFGML